MAEEVRPPDLAAAGPPAPSDDGLMSALRQSQAPLPLAGNPMFQMGSALQGFASGMRGHANPALEFLEVQERQRERQVRTQFQLAGIQERRRKDQASQAKNELSILQGLMSNSDALTPEAKSALGKDFGATYKRAFGSEANPLYIEQIMNKPLSTDRLKALLIDSRTGLSDEAVSDKYKVPLARVADYKKMVTDPIVLKSLFGMTVDDLDLAGSKASHTRTANWAQEHGYTLGSDRWRDLTTVAQDVYKKTPQDLTPPELLQAQAKAQSVLEQRERGKEQRHLADQITLQRERDLAAAARQREHDDRVAERDRTKVDAKADEQRVKREKGAHAALTLAQQVKIRAQGLSESGYLATDNNRLAVGGAAVKRWLFPGDEVGAFASHAGTMVSLARATGDIGGRAKAAYDSLIKIVEHPTTVKALNGAVDDLVEAIKAEVPGIQVPETRLTSKGKIRVRRKADGKTGTIDAGDFDPAKYEKQ